MGEALDEWARRDWIVAGTIFEDLFHGCLQGLRAGAVSLRWLGLLGQGGDDVRLVGHFVVGDEHLLEQAS